MLHFNSTETCSSYDWACIHANNHNIPNDSDCKRHPNLRNVKMWKHVHLRILGIQYTSLCTYVSVCLHLQHNFYHPLPRILYSSHANPLTVLCILHAILCLTPFNLQCPLSGSPSSFLLLAVSSTLTHLSNQSSHVSSLEKTSLPHKHSSLPHVPLEHCTHFYSCTNTEVGNFLCSTRTPEEQELCCLHFDSMMLCTVLIYDRH